MRFIKSLIRQQKSNQRKISNLFDDSERAKDFSIKAAGIFLDYSKQNISRYELSQLLAWVKNKGLNQWIKSLTSGDKVNVTENRKALHSLLRAPLKTKQEVLGKEADEVDKTEKRMFEIIEGITEGRIKSATGEKYTDVLTIGIGGSYYGIKVALSALTHYHCTGLNVHVLASVDGAAVEDKLKKLNASTTLVVVISKTFTTQETMINAQVVKRWMISRLPLEGVIKQQWFAVSTAVEKVKSFGLQDSHILPMWDWVGGRFSLWSAVGLPLGLAIGNKHFSEFKNGAYQMDQHFQQADFEHNMPIIMALIGLWNRNGFDFQNLAILPYSHNLLLFPGYLQQLDMESNGKSVSTDGIDLLWPTAPVIFGQEGTNSQHAFMQLMHQSKLIIPADFIVALQGSNHLEKNHKILVANCFAQSEALMQGKSYEQVKSELTPGSTLTLAVHKVMKGNTPTNTLLMKSISPESFGALIALYEHKTCVQGFLWQVNSFDQWGVELGKELGTHVLNKIKGSADNFKFSASTSNLIQMFVSGEF